MAKTQKKKKDEQPLDADAQLLQEVIGHQKASERWLSTISDTWDEKEAMLIGQLEDSLSKKTKNKVFDPRLSTVVFERAARVMAQSPRGKAFAVSKDDVGKNALMNLLLNYYRKNDNSQYSHLIKLRMLDLYSMVYGSMFAMVTWVVNPKNNYIGPSLYILPIRDCFPQPGRKNIDEMDWFTVRTMVSAESLRNVDGTVWKKGNIERLLNELKSEKSEGDINDSSDRKSYVERSYFPGEEGDTAYPQIELFTEYRGDKWITWAPQRIDKETSHPYLLRVIDNTYPEQMLPIVTKHCFPLLDSPIGLGEFERGKTLQYAINSLINLYLDGVKYSIFPPLAINPDNVVPSSIKWGAGEKWFMNNPNQDVQPVSLSPQGIGTFNSTYGFLLSALYNQAGTSEVTKSEQVDNSLGKTPQAIRLQAVREGARDEWDRFMMEECIKDIYRRMIALTTSKMETEVAIRIFGEELNEIKASYPDVVQLFKSGERGEVKITKKNLGTQYDYELETGSTLAPNIDAEQGNLTSILRAVTENPAILQALQAKGKSVDIPELFKRWMQAGGVKDVDKIIVETPVEAATPGAVKASESDVPAEDEVTPVEGGEEAVAESIEPSEGGPEFSDPDIQALARQMFGTDKIPPTTNQ